MHSEAGSSASPGRAGWFRLAFLGLVVLGAGLILAWAAWPVTVLEIRAGTEERLVKSLPVDAGERIVYTYRHSIQTTLVDEILEVAPGGRLVVRETLYDMTGVGLPSDVPDGEVSIDPATNRFRISNMSRDLSPWRVRVGYVSEQTLRVRDLVFRLDSLAPPPTLLVVRPVEGPRIAILARR